jgi:hypothetical protein
MSMSRTISGNRAVLAALLVFFALPAASPCAPAGASLTYRKIFKGSNPEFVELKVSDAGNCTYDIRQLSDEPDPQLFEVGEGLRAKIFDMAAQLNNFRDADLDVKRRIANLGEKTFLYERGSERYEARFNYTINATAQQLMMLFEGLARQQDHLQTLIHRMKYDRLGVNKALLNFEVDFDRKIIPEPERLIPALQRLADDSRYVDIARQRARALIEKIRNGA